STATKRPTYSSWSASILLIGFAMVTWGGGGVAACDCDRLSPQAASAGMSRSSTISRRTDCNAGANADIVSGDIKLIVQVLLLRDWRVRSQGCTRQRTGFQPDIGREHRLGSPCGLRHASVELLDTRAYTPKWAHIHLCQRMLHRRTGLQTCMT